MAIWSTALASDAINECRLDADYFKPDDQEHLARMLKIGGKPLGNMSPLCIITGKTPSNYNNDGPVPVVRSGDLVNTLIYPGNGQPYLRTDPNLGYVALQKGDVLISSIGMGSIGKVAIVTESGDFVTVSEVTILRDYPSSPEFLFTYLSTPQGQAQIERQITGATGQQHLLKSKVEKLIIPEPPSKIEDIIQKMVQEAALFSARAIGEYDNAEQALISALALDHIDLAPRLFYEASFVDISSAARLDADYYAPRTQNIIAGLSRDGRAIADVAPLAKRQFKPKPGEPFDYIEIADLAGGGMAESETIYGEEAPSRAQWIVKPGDIITSMVRPIRRLSAMIQPEQRDFVCSSGFAVLQPTDVDPEILLVYLRLPLVCELLGLNTTASMYPAISTADLLRIPISLPDKQARQRIVEQVRESFGARKRAKIILDDAKLAVESAFEDSEEAALQFLKGKQR